MKIYLVNEYEEYCPENGDYTVAVFSSVEKAQDYKKRKIAEDSYYNYTIQEVEVDSEQ